MAETIKQEPKEPSDDDFMPTGVENPSNFQIGEIVWARHGTEAYWPGKIHGFNKQYGKCGASIVWLGVDTYSPFIELGKVDRFVESYGNR